MTTPALQSRMRNPVSVVPGTMDALQALAACPKGRGVPPHTLELVHPRASQITDGSVCVDLHSRNLKKGRRDRPAPRRGGRLAAHTTLHPGRTRSAGPG